MPTNRIQRYENLWKTEEPQPSTRLPSGFALVSLGHLSPEQLAAVAAQKSLYQWAYDRARADVDERFVNDWII